MKITFRQDLVGAVVFLTVSAILWFLIPYQIVTDEDDVITAQTFPRLIIGLMALCSAVLLIKELTKLIRKQPSKMVEIHFQQELRSLFIVGLLVLYWGLLHWLPFMFASILFAYCCLLFFRCHKWHYYAIVTAVIVSVSLFFQHFLNVSLP